MRILKYLHSVYVAHIACHLGHHHWNDYLNRCEMCDRERP